MRNNLAIAVTESLVEAARPPQEREGGELKPRWTTRRFVEWLQDTYGFRCCRETCRRALKRLGFSWKKARKLLNKADTAAREAFFEKLKGLLDSATRAERFLVYIDEAHIHLDTDEGFGWSVKGERFWVSSSSPGRKKVSFFGAYLYNKGEVRLYPYETANGTNTVDVLRKIRGENPEVPITVIWDGVSYHRGAYVTAAADELDIEIQRLPGYSPDFMPVEHLWQWLREEVTYHTCHNTQDSLIRQAACFQERINASPHHVADRLWTKTSLDCEVEKLRFSN